MEFHYKIKHSYMCVVRATTMKDVRLGNLNENFLSYNFKVQNGRAYIFFF